MSYIKSKAFVATHILSKELGSWSGHLCLLLLFMTHFLFLNVIVVNKLLASKKLTNNYSKHHLHSWYNTIMTTSMRILRILTNCFKMQFFSKFLVIYSQFRIRAIGLMRHKEEMTTWLSKLHIHFKE